jgi:putative nucleotidyltransferase with HDIG domain
MITSSSATGAQAIGAALISFDAALDVRDSGTYGHSIRTAFYSVLLGRLLRLPDDELVTLKRGAFLHDIGKVHIPDRILKKSGALTDGEWRIMRHHAVMGYAMLSSVRGLSTVASIVLAHHERYDGTGYPHRLEGKDIPLGARICAVADCFDALTASDRSYRQPLTFPEAWDYIGSQRGAHFDPHVVDAFRILSPRDWRRIEMSLSRAGHRRLRWEAASWESTVAPGIF